MAVPAFSFTSRAVPVAQIGRPGPLAPADVAWADIGCDVHEITTDTGRGSTSDRYAPGTAVITASNVSGWADGTVPIDWTYFADEFNRTGPALGSHWARWLPVEDWFTADPLELVAEAAQVQAHRSDVTVAATVTAPIALHGSWIASGAAAATATIGPFPGIEAGDVVFMALALNYVTPTTGPEVTIPGWEYISLNPNWGGTGLPNFFELYSHRVQPEEAANAATWTWEADLTMTTAWHYTAVAFGGAGVPAQLNYFSFHAAHPEFAQWWYPWVAWESGTGFLTPTPGCVAVRFAGGVAPHPVTPISTLQILQHDAATSGWTFDGLVGVEINPDGSLHEWPEDVYIPGTKLDWTTPPASGGEWSGEITLLVIPGPAPDPNSIPHEGASTAIWGLGYDGDQFIDVSMTGLAAPDKLWPDGSAMIQLALKADEASIAASLVQLDWAPSWSDPDVAGVLTWYLFRRNDDGSIALLATDDVTVDAPFPEPVRFRFEAEDGGPVRVYMQGELLGSGTDPTPPTGDRIGIYAQYQAGAVSLGGSDQMGPPRFETVVGGSNLPVPILLEPGVRVRIGVHHATFGDRWFFHGYVDAIVPVYDPSANPVSRIECIDPLGEIGRLPLTDIGGFQPEEASERVARLFAEADWPPALSEIHEDATWMDNRNTSPDRAVELLTQTAESCGGAVYGDPQTGQLVFRARDWQAWDPDLPPDGYITNASTPAGALAACPSTWERSWRREDMTTRATFTSGLNEKRTYSNPDAEARFGVEPYDRTVVATEIRILNILGRRQLKLRGPGAFPRVAAVLLDAATSVGALDVMTAATFTLPHRFQCGLVRDGIVVFDRQYFVTGIRHTITRDRWQCRFALDIADVFATKGARWGRGHWGVGVWGRSI